MLDSNPMLGSRVGLETAHHAYSVAYIRSGAKHRIHETSNCRSVRNSSHVFLFLRSLRRLLLGEVYSMSEREKTFL
ncbi:hypothetical protein, partial [Escherichia coli]|uniref:hypothetical protein n=1 Tax=Escherichia coli TaxID=562 RepID=UPI002243E4F4